jgi:hypothetical protein
MKHRLTKEAAINLKREMAFKQNTSSRFQPGMGYPNKRYRQDPQDDRSKVSTGPPQRKTGTCLVDNVHVSILNRR